MEDRVLAWLIALATAAPSAFVPQSHGIYDTARKELADKGGPLERMKGLMSAIVDRVGKRITQAVQQLAQQPDANGGAEFNIDETVQKILEGSTEDLAYFNRVQGLREQRKTATQLARDRAWFLQYYSLLAILMAMATLGLWYWTKDWRVFALPGGFLLGWIGLQMRLSSARRAEDRISDDYATIEAHYLDVA